MKDNCTAITTDGESIEWARTEKSRGRDAPVATGSFGKLPVETDFPDAAAFAKASEAYARKVASKLPDSATLALATSDLIFRTARLPATDVDEIAAMSRNQMEKDAPLPMEEMVCSFEILTSDETSSLVLSACAPVVAVEATSTLAGIEPRRVERVDASILGILRVLADKGALAPTGREVLLIDEGRNVTLAIVSETCPLLIRSSGLLETFSAGDLLNAARIGLIQAQVNHGAAELVRIVCVSDSLRLQDAANTLADALDCSAKILSPRTLPPAAFGNALRSTSPSGTQMNLFPDVWRDRLAEGRFHRIFCSTLLAGAVIWLMLLGWLYGWPALLDQRAKSLGAEVNRLAPAAAKVNDIRNRIKIIDTYSDRTFSFMEILLEVAVNQPQGIDLSSFRYNGAKRATFVEGRARVPTVVYEFMDRLKTSPLLREVKLTSGPTLNKSLGLNVFELSLDLKTREQMEAKQP